MREYWHRQASDTPLFPDLAWSRPEHTALAGKLLIVGGNAHGFATPATAYADALKAGVGAARVLLPGALQKTVGRTFPAGEFAPSTPSGSFSRQALAELLSLSAWADGTLLAGEFGRNSETAVLLETFAGKYTGQLTLTTDAADYFMNAPASILSRPGTLLVLSFAQLQRLATAAHFPQAFTFNMDLLHLADALHAFTEAHQAHIVIKHLQTIAVAASGQVSTTQLAADIDIWRLRTAARAAVWWLQNPAKPYEAITDSLIGTTDI